MYMAKCSLASDPPDLNAEYFRWSWNVETNMLEPVAIVIVIVLYFVPATQANIARIPIQLLLLTIKMSNVTLVNYMIIMIW